VPTASPSPEIRLLQRFLRRWPVGLLGLLATVALCLAAIQLVPIRYSAKADLLLTPPQIAPTSGETGNPNPYLQLGGLQPLADIMSRSMTSSSALDQLRQKGLVGSYTVARDTTTDGPILIVTASGDSSTAVLKDLALVIGSARPQLDRLQAARSVAGKNQVTTTVVAKDTAATPSRKSQVRALVVAIVAGLVGTALGVVVIDMLLLRRRVKRVASAQNPDMRGTRAPPGSIRSRRPPAGSPPSEPVAPATASRSGDRLATRMFARSRGLIRPFGPNRHNGADHGDRDDATLDVVTAVALEDRAAPEDTDGAGTRDRAEPARRARPRPGPEPSESMTPSATSRTRRRMRAVASPQAADPPRSREPDADDPAREDDPTGRVGTHSP